MQNSKSWEGFPTQQDREDSRAMKGRGASKSPADLRSAKAAHRVNQFRFSRDLYRHLLTHGSHVGARPEVDELSRGVDGLERIGAQAITFADLERAFSPVLSVVGTRRLMLCRYDGIIWVDVALSEAKRRFIIPPELEARIRSLLRAAEEPHLP